MEIGHYLRARPRTTALALLFPLLAGVLAFVILQGQPNRYTATATVSVPGSAADSASRVGIFVADFAELATSRPVDREVAGSTGESLSDLSSNVQVARIGESSLFTVSYTGQKRQAVEPTVRGVITGTFNRLNGVSVSDATYAQATKDYTAAVNARAAYQDQIGTIQPDRDYQDLSARIRGLQLAPVFGGDQLLGQLNSERAALVPQIRRLQELDQAVQDAANRRGDAQRAAVTAQRELSQTRSPNAIRDLSVTTGTRLSRIVQGVGVAVVAGLLCGIAVLVLPELLRRRQPTASERPHEVVDRPTSLRTARDAS